MTMPHSRTFRVMFVGSLLTATAGMIAFAGWVFWPIWQEHRAVEQLIAALAWDEESYQDGNPVETAIENMKKFRDGVAAIGPLMEAMKSEDGRIRFRARWVLLMIGEPAFPALLKAAADKNENWRVRDGAISTLAFKRTAGITSLLTELLHDDDPHFRERAAWGLFVITLGPAQKLESNSTVPPLIEALRDPEPRVRRWAAEALGGYGSEAKDAVPELIKLLQDKEPRERPREREHGGHEMLDHLDVRSVAIESLGEIGKESASAIPALLELASDEDEHVRKLAAAAIEKIRGENPDSGESRP